MPRNNKIKETPQSSRIKKEPIRDTVNPRQIPQEDTVTDVEKYNINKTPPPFLNKVNYEGDIDENNYFTDNLRTKNDDCVRNRGGKENEENR